MLKFLLFFGYRLFTLYCKTWRVKITGEEYIDQYISEKKGLVIALWHDQLLPLTISRRNKGMATIASKSEDGEIITGLLHLWGYAVARGSSSRSGAAALVAARKMIKQGFPLAVTVDGPIGPRHEVKPGAVYLAKVTNSDIMPAFARVKGCIRFGSWDRLIMPLPFAQIEVFFTAPITVTQDTSEKAMKQSLRKIEKIMLERTSEITPDFI